MTAAWIPCPFCPEFWCNIHGQHAFECGCPPIDEWETDPYGVPPMTLSDRLRRMLADRGCSASEAAKLAGMGRQQVWRIVSGANPNPEYLTLLRLVEAVGGTLGELFTDED